MPKLRIPKRQHYVPKFYLKEFANDDTYGKKDKAQVHIYDVTNEKKDIRNIKTIAYAQYLYSPKNEDGDRSAYMEDKLADLESLMSEIWPKFVNNRMGLSQQMKKAISVFISTLIFRHPDNLDKNEHLKHFLYKDIMKHIPQGEKSFTFSANRNESIITVAEMEEAMNASDYDKSMYFLDNIDYFSLDIAERLVKKKWSVIASKEKVFITSDRPVIISNPETGLLGIESPGVIITFPLSPTRLLILEDNINNEEDLTEYPLNKGHESYYNHPIFSNAYRYIIGHRDLEVIINNMYEYYYINKKPWWKFW